MTSLETYHLVFGKTGVAEPAFDVLLSRATSKCPYEIRRYGTRFAIETEYSGQDGAGFRALAGYIGVGTSPQNDGGKSIAMTAPVVTEAINKKGTSIAMTAPVVTDTAQDGNTRMQFILPAEYDDMSKIPKPTNPKVTLTEVKPQVGAVHKFSGWIKDDKGKSKVTQLVEQLKEDGVDIDEKKALDSFLLWQYNPPFTIPNLRRNEVWLDLNEAQVKELLKKQKDLN